MSERQGRLFSRVGGKGTKELDQRRMPGWGPGERKVNRKRIRLLQAYVPSKIWTPKRESGEEKRKIRLQNECPQMPVNRSEVPERILRGEEGGRKLTSPRTGPTNEKKDRSKNTFNHNDWGGDVKTSLGSQCP